MNRLIKTFLILLIILVISETIVKAETDNSAFHGEPSYSLFTFSDSMTVNNREDILIGLFISGAGDVDAGKLRVSIPDYIVKNNEVFSTHFGYGNNKILDSTVTTSESGFGSTLAVDLFYNKNDMGLFNFGEIAIIHNNTKKAPISFSFSIDNNAPSGDHTISILLFYKNGGKWYKSEKEIIIHVRHWYEKEYVQYLSIFLIGVNIISILVNFFRKSKR